MKGACCAGRLGGEVGAQWQRGVPGSYGRAALHEQCAVLLGAVRAGSVPSAQVGRRGPTGFGLCKPQPLVASDKFLITRLFALNMSLQLVAALTTS